MENIILSEISQTQRVKYHMFSFIHAVLKSQVRTSRKQNDYFQDLWTQGNKGMMIVK